MRAINKTTYRIKIVIFKEIPVKFEIFGIFQDPLYLFGIKTNSKKPCAYLKANLFQTPSISPYLQKKQ